MADHKVAYELMPSAAPSEEEIARWLALPREERERRVQRALEIGFSSGVSTRSIDEIIADARRLLDSA